MYEKFSYTTLGNIVDTKNNEKVKSSKGYETWAEKHNMKTIASTLNEFRKYDINSLNEIEQKLQDIALNRQKILNDIKQKEKDMALIYSTIENLNNPSKNKLTYDMYKKNPKDKFYYEKYKAEIIAYETTKKSIDISPYKDFILKYTVLTIKYREIKILSI